MINFSWAHLTYSSLSNAFFTCKSTLLREFVDVSFSLLCEIVFSRKEFPRIGIGYYKSYWPLFVKLLLSWGLKCSPVPLLNVQLYWKYQVEAWGQNVSFVWSQVGINSLFWLSPFPFRLQHFKLIILTSFLHCKHIHHVLYFIYHCFAFCLSCTLSFQLLLKALKFRFLFFFNLCKPFLTGKR